MRVITVLFGLTVAGIVFSFGMGIYTGVKENRERNAPSPITIPTPALPQTP